MSKDISLNDIIKKLNSWKAESKNPRNDGWMQAGFRQNIKKIFKESAKLLKRG